MDVITVLMAFVLSFLVSFGVCTHNAELSKVLCPALFSSLIAIAVFLI